MGSDKFVRPRALFLFCFLMVGSLEGLPFPNEEFDFV